VHTISPGITKGVTPPHLFLSTKNLEELGTFGKVRPPLREEADRIYLLTHLDRIDCVGTDHAPHTPEEKEGDYQDASIKVYAEGSDSAIFNESGQSTYSLQLRYGSYRVEAGAEGYAVKRESIDIGPNETDVEIVVQKSIDVKIIGFEAAFPEQLFVGQAKQVEVQLENRSSSSQQVELVPTGDLEGVLQEAVVSLAPGATETTTLEVSVPGNTSIKDTSKGDEKKGGIRIKYTGEKAEAEFTILPDPGAKITLSDADFSAEAIKGKNKDTVTIKATNRNKFALDGLVLSIEIPQSSAMENDADEVKSWFRLR